MHSALSNESRISLYAIVPLGYFHPPFSGILPEYFHITRFPYQLLKCTPRDMSLPACSAVVSKRRFAVNFLGQQSGKPASPRSSFYRSAVASLPAPGLSGSPSLPEREA